MSAQQPRKEEIGCHAALHVIRATAKHLVPNDLGAPRVVCPLIDRLRADHIDMPVENQRFSAAGAGDLTSDIWSPREGHPTVAGVRLGEHRSVQIPNLDIVGRTAQVLGHVRLHLGLMPKLTRSLDQLGNDVDQLIGALIDLLE